MMRLFITLIAILILSGCNSNETTDTTIERDASERPELSLDSKIFFGNRLFSEKTCITCHAIDKRKIGPSVIDIVRVYKENNGNIEAFLRGKSEPIVDTDTSKIAIMQANIDGFLKEVTDEELNAISTYMLYIAEKEK